MEKGNIIKFRGATDGQIEYGGGDDPRGCLEVGREYEIIKTYNYDWYTLITIKGFPDFKFNSVCFTSVRKA